MPDFPGFHDSDFDAYAPNKWASNVFNLERLRVKEKLEGLAHALIDAMSFDPPLSWEVSSEHPALWNNHEVRSQDLFFLRSEEDRKLLFAHIAKRRRLGSFLQEPSPFLEHVHLAITVSHQGLRISMTLMPEATLDHENLIRKLDDPWQRSKIAALIEELPDNFQKRLGDREVTDAEQMVSSLEQTKVNPEAKVAVLCICSELDRSDPLVDSPAVFDHIKADLTALEPIFRFVQWDRENDHLHIVEAMRKTRVEQKKKGISVGDRVRITDGLWAGKSGEVTGMDSRGQAKVLVGKMTVQVKADDLIKKD